MTDDPGERGAMIAAAEAAMTVAAAREDFEEAKRQRDRINFLRGGGALNEVYTVDDAGLGRQRPGAMGIGSSQQRGRTPPEGWQPPKKPDPMTRNRGRGQS